MPSPKPSLASVVVTLLFGAVLLVTAPLCVLLGLLLLLVTFPFDRDRGALHALVCHWTFGYLRLNPLWRVRVEGRERLPQGAAVLVANHQSLADVVVAMGLFHPYKFVSKVSLFRLPLVGWMMHLIRHIPLHRGRPGSTRAMLETSRHWLRRGMAVFFFPEGTYAEGEQLLPFRSGAFLLAIEEQVPVVPIFIEGTRRLVDGDGPWLGPRADVRVRVLEPRVPPKDADAQQVADAVRLELEGLQRTIFGFSGRAR
ncbi:MAG: lysophospholipid acyltransferase family protein [Myxococcaceae bacterium]